AIVADVFDFFGFIQRLGEFEAHGSGTNPAPGKGFALLQDGIVAGTVALVMHAIYARVAYLLSRRHLHAMPHSLRDCTITVRTGKQNGTEVPRLRKTGPKRIPPELLAGTSGFGGGELQQSVGHELQRNAPALLGLGLVLAVAGKIKGKIETFAGRSRLSFRMVIAAADHELS